MSIRNILDLLRNGEVICPVSHASEFRALEMGAEEDVEKALAPYERTLKKGDGYYFCGYTNLNNREDRTAIKAQFQSVRDTIQPVIECLTLFMRAFEQEEVFLPGEEIKLSALAETISNEAAFQKDLERISSIKGFSSHKTAPTITDRLTKVANGLVDLGYLKVLNQELQIYSVTGRINYFYAVIDFIVEHEELEIELPEQTEQQQELL